MWGLAALQGATPKCGSQWSWGDCRAPSSAFCAADNFGGALLHTPPCAFWCPLPTPGVRFGAAEPLAFNASMCLGTPCLYVSPPAIEVPGGGYKITPSNLTFFPRRWEFWWPQPPTPPPPLPPVPLWQWGPLHSPAGVPGLAGWATHPLSPSLPGVTKGCDSQWGWPVDALM